MRRLAVADRCRVTLGDTRGTILRKGVEATETEVVCLPDECRACYSLDLSGARIAHRSFADFDRGLARCSSGLGRINSSAMEE